MRHRRTQSHKILPQVRNKIKIDISDKYNTYCITVSNVNYDNFEPSKITIKLMNNDRSILTKCRGAVVGNSEKYCHDIPNFTDITPC